MSDTRTDIEIPPTGLLPESHVEQPAPAEREPTARERAMVGILASRQRALEAEIGHADEHASAEPADSREQYSATRPTNPALGEVEADRDYQDPYAVAESPASQPTPLDRSAPERPAEAIGEKSTTDVVATRAAPQTFAVRDTNGNELYVTQEQLVHLASMGVVANQALHQYQTQQFQQPQPQYQQQMRAPEPQPPAPAIDDERIARTVKAIQYGDEATAATALRELIGSVRLPQAPQIDAVAIGNYAAQRARLEAKLEAETQIIRQEYAEIMADPDLAHLAGMKVAQLRQRNQSLGQQQSDLDVFREAGNLVLDKIGKPRPNDPNGPRGGGVPSPRGNTEPTAPQAPNIVVRRSSGEIDARKRAAPRAMSQVIDRRSAAPQAPRAPTASDVVELMRKGRGQTSMR